MRFIFVLIWFCCSFNFVLAQDINILLQEGEKLERTLNEKAALEKFQQVIKLQPGNLQALNKCSELCSRVGNRETTPKARLNYYEAAKTYATIALQVQPSNSAANCMMAIALGRASLEKSGKEKVKAAREIKKYADLAIQYDPQNAKAWHVLGRWYYEISDLGFIEKAAVKVLFGGVPKSSFKQAVHAYEKAKSLSPGFVLNYLELARAYEKSGQDDKAIAVIKEMLLLPDTTEDDNAAKKAARKLLQSLE